jgi:branched-chain amino acid transport system substrate-binding protein
MGERLSAWRSTRSGGGLGRSQLVGLGVLAVVVAGAIVLVLALSGGGSSAHSASPSLSAVPAHATPAPANTSAVAEALRHGQLNVVLDQPASGSFAEQNHLIADGAQVAVEELNAAAGLPGHVHLNLVQQSLDGLSPSAVQAQLASAGAGVLVLPCDTDSALSLAGAGAHYGTLMLGTCNYEPAAAQRYPTYWSVGSPGTQEAAELVNFMNNEGYLGVYVVGASGSAYGERMTNDFVRAARAKGLSILGSTSVDPTTQDFSGLAQTIKGTEPKLSAVFTSLSPPAANRLGAALHTNVVDAVVFGTSALSAPITLKSGAADLNNALFTSYGFPREDSAGKRFASDYEKQFGTAPVGSFPGLGYETIRLLEAGANQAHSASPTAIEQALAQGLVLSGVALGNRRYLAGSNHNPISEVGLEKLVEKSKLEAVTSGSPRASGVPRS